jgi:hypothetical protein
MMNRSTRDHIDVKNLCSRKLYELYACRAADTAELDAIIDELQLRRHYLNELERLQSPHTTRH